jgi:DNA-binding transcriptional MerR regulator
MPLSVSELASRAGISPDTVRYYGRVGLLPETGRTSGGHRYYDDAALERLRFIKGAQWFELRLDEIRTLLDAFEADACACGHTAELVRGRIAAIDEQRARLEEMRAALCRLLDDPDTTKEGASMTTVLTTETADARAEEAGPGCGCCIPPPGASAERELSELQARREAVERRLRGIRSGATA